MYHRWLKRQFTLSEQFLLISFAILLGGMLLIGWWVSSRIENAVTSQTADMTTLYMESIVAPLVQDLADRNTANPAQQHQLEQILTDSSLGTEVVLFKLWSPDGTILYSTEPSLIGLRFSPEDELASALNGVVVSHLSALDKPENVLERERWSALIETYAPVHQVGTDRVIAVAEFYQNAEPLLSQITNAQQQSWLMVAVATLAMYGLLSGLVHTANRTITRQQAQLRQSVDELTTLLAENRNLHQRLQTAAARATELNEEFLRRIGRDLHDGPAQDLALALLHIDDLCQTNPARQDTVRHALQSALGEIRALAAGLQLPELETLGTVEVSRRAVREFQRKTRAAVKLDLEETLPEVSLPKKIALYRVITEALYNAFRHAGAKDVAVRLSATTETIYLEVCDGGPGFDPTALVSRNGHLGLAGLQQRVALLAGTFEVESSEHAGTCIRVHLPLESD